MKPRKKFCEKIRIDPSGVLDKMKTGDEMERVFLSLTLRLRVSLIL